VENSNVLFTDQPSLFFTPLWLLLLYNVMKIGRGVKGFLLFEKVDDKVNIMTHFSSGNCAKKEDSICIINRKLIRTKKL